METNSNESKQEEKMNLEELTGRDDLENFLCGLSDKEIRGIVVDYLRRGLTREAKLSRDVMAIVFDEIKRRKEKSESKESLRIMAINYCNTILTTTPCDRVNLFNSLRKQVRLDVLEGRNLLAKETVDAMYELIAEVKQFDRQFGKGEICAMKE